MYIKFFVFILCISAVYSLSFAKPSIDLSLYHNSSQVEQIIDQLIQNNTNLHKRQCSMDGFNYSILDIKSKKQNGTLNALITCNVHARELFTTQACVQFIKSLTNSTNKRAKYLTDNVNFRVFYIANQMRDQALNGDYCRRTDSKNVDINRNFPSGFQGEKVNKQTNPGAAPLSQPFSKCLQAQINSQKPDIYLDVHTGQFSLYYTQSDDQNNVSNQLQQKVLKKIVKNACANCRVREDTPQGVIFTDLKVRKKIKWSNLLEIYGAYNANWNQNENCFNIFSPTTKTFFDFYMNKAINIMSQYFLGVLEVQKGQNQK